jgi:hypothetical protein
MKSLEEITKAMEEWARGGPPPIKSPELEEIKNAMTDSLRMAKAWNEAVESGDPLPYRLMGDLETRAAEAGRALNPEEIDAVIKKWYDEHEKNKPRTGGA